MMRSTMSGSRLEGERPRKRKRKQLKQAGEKLNLQRNPPAARQNLLVQVLAVVEQTSRVKSLLMRTAALAVMMTRRSPVTRTRVMQSVITVIKCIYITMYIVRLTIANH